MDIKVYVRYDLNKEHEFTVASGTSSGAVFDKERYTLSVTGSGNLLLPLMARLQVMAFS